MNMTDTQPTIYQLYQNNIGMIVPMIKDAIDAAEDDYPYEWICEAIKIAVMNNARSWKYIEAILKRWETRGFNAPQRLPHNARGDHSECNESIMKYGEWDSR